MPGTGILDVWLAGEEKTGFMQNDLCQSGKAWFNDFLTTIQGRKGKDIRFG